MLRESLAWLFPNQAEDHTHLWSSYNADPRALGLRIWNLVDLWVRWNRKKGWEFPNTILDGARFEDLGKPAWCFFWGWRWGRGCYSHSSTWSFKRGTVSPDSSLRRMYRRKVWKGAVRVLDVECGYCLWVYTYQLQDFSHLLQLPEENGVEKWEMSTD